MNCVYFLFFHAFLSSFFLNCYQASTYDSQVDNRIYRGTIALPKQFPWMAAIYRRKYNNVTKKVNKLRGFFKRCGGSIISDYYVLTTAHCFYKYKTKDFIEYQFAAEDVRVVTGLVDLRTAEDIDLRIVEKLLMHDQYDAFTFANDIALIKLMVKLIFNQVIQPIQMSFKWVNIGQLSTIAGWGDTCNVEEDKYQLRYVKVETVGNEKCLKNGVPLRVTSNSDYRTFICVGPGSRIGSGDSGSGLWLTENGENDLIGLVSQGYNCLNKSLVDLIPASFTRISYYQEWIEHKTLEI